MLTTRIIKIDSIEFDKAGNRIDLTIIRTANSALPIIRRTAEFLTDLKNARLLTNRAVNSIWHSSVQRICKELENGGTVTGNIRYTKVGDTWTVSETSSCVTNPNHPQAGVWTIGMQIPVEKPSSIVDGFLNFDYSEAYKTRLIDAEMYAERRAEMLELVSMPVQQGVAAASQASELPNTAIEDAFDQAFEEFDVDVTASTATAQEDETVE